MSLNKVLQLERPLAIFDVETTGLNPERDRIIQLGITMFYPDPNREPLEWHQLINPECEIPPGMNHGITTEMVEEEPTFPMLAPELQRLVFNDVTDIAGYNIANFDIPFLKFEFARSAIMWEPKCHIIDVFLLYKKFHGATLEHAYKRYVDKQGFKGAHHAGVDVAATWKVLLGQLTEHPEIPRIIGNLSEFCFAKPQKQADWVDEDGKLIWKDGQVVFNFGKHRGTPLKAISRGYLMWLSNADFPPAFKQIILDALEGKYPVRS